MKLNELGEFRLLGEVVLPTLGMRGDDAGLGDDCAFLPLPSGNVDLVVTADAAPRPLAWKLGHDSYRTWGWYAVVVNLSDLASAGACPIGFTTSVEATPEMDVDCLREFFEGVAEACGEFSAPNAGGNLRSAATFACHGTAFGTVGHGMGISRCGCKPGDHIVSIGECGGFASTFLEARARGIDSLDDRARQSLLRPRPRLWEMQLLAERRFITASSDNSDGVLGAIFSIAERSRCCIELDLRQEVIPPSVAQTARSVGLDPWNLMFCWGDWQVIAAIEADSFGDFERTACERSIPFVPLGHAVEGEPAIITKLGGNVRRLSIVRNENFAHGSFNTNMLSGIERISFPPINI